MLLDVDKFIEDFVASEVELQPARGEDGRVLPRAEFERRVRQARRDVLARSAYPPKLWQADDGSERREFIWTHVGAITSAYLDALPTGAALRCDSLALVDCPRLLRLPSRVVVAEDLLVAACPRLYQVARLLSVGGRMRVSECGAMRRIAGAFKKPWSIVVDGNPNLIVLARRFWWHGSVKVARCFNLRLLQDNMPLSDNITVIDCPNLETRLGPLYPWQADPHHPTSTTTKKQKTSHLR